MKWLWNLPVALEDCEVVALTTPDEIGAVEVDIEFEIADINVALVELREIVEDVLFMVVCTVLPLPLDVVALGVGWKLSAEEIWYGNDVLELGSEPFDSIDLLGEALFVSLVLLIAEALNFEFDSAEREVLEEIREPP